MSKMYAISRIANYKFNDVGGVLKEALRTLPNYNNPDCNPELSYLNVALIKCDLQNLSPEKYILKYREDNNIKGRFNTTAVNPKSLTNCMCQCLMTASSEWISELSRDEQIDYFKNCLEFFKGEFDVPVLSAIIHFDETTPHMHISFLPIVERVNKKTGEIENIFSTTKLMPGKDFYPKYQDRFYKFISEKYDGFSRGKSNRKNMSPQQYKEYQDLKNECALLRSKLNDCYKTIDNQKDKIKCLYDELREVREHNILGLLERVPLLCILFSLLRQLSDECCRSVLVQSIELAKREIKRNSREIDETSIEYKISVANKQKILNSVFPQNKQNER